MRRSPSILLVAFLGATLTLSVVHDANARPPLCCGSAGQCSWEVGFDPDLESNYYMMMCPSGGGAVFLISPLDAALACEGAGSC